MIALEDKIIVQIRIMEDLTRNNLTQEENLIKTKDNIAAIDLLDQEKKKEIENQLNALSAMEKDTYQETVQKMINPNQQEIKKIILAKETRKCLKIKDLMIIECEQ